MKDKGKNSELETVLRWLRSLFVPSLGLTLRVSACRDADDLGDTANQQSRVFQPQITAGTTAD
ncbi:hypothetical protein [Hafnia paralvei]|uniref:Uncharacterized protein n=1 Tax=Hafnia paralvei TaxID=546367 RepID=A0A4Q9EMX7_9GAMM|nr:hypothetical protein [Hafnia paralvei]TBM25279.1 hypothetical protein EYY89_13520 [Hafnia paralvei]